ncbi:MAG TPA: flagellar hook protein FlgE [Vulgatibacter sp.]|nr:flagellar hook protein FlgE [Vulgatibacter sp.]
MSLFSSLYAGASGLNANSLELAVVGDNIANANTIGFKASRAAFADALAENMIGAGQRGTGTQVQAIQRLFRQGATLGTGNSTDLAIEGAGFFVVKGERGGIGGNFFTRAGQFTVDNDGYLATLDGLRLQGYPADPTGAISRTIGDLQLAGISSPPNATTEIVMKANLQADATIPAPFDPTDPANTSNFNSAITIYDSLGTAHHVDVYFSKTGAGTWEWHALVDGGTLAGGTAGTPTEIASGTLTFDGAGKLVSQTQTSSFTPAGALSPQALSFDFGDPLSTGGTGLAGITQFSSPSAMKFQNQDGYSAGSFASVSIDENGLITGTFTNGHSRSLGQLVLANFQAPDQLERLGGNLFAATRASGPATIGLASTGGRGAIASGALEQSTVDIANEFIRMIAAQRGFQANSKTLTTADQLLADLIQIKR